MEHALLNDESESGQELVGWQEARWGGGGRFLEHRGRNEGRFPGWGGGLGLALAPAGLTRPLPPPTPRALQGS